VVSTDADSGHTQLYRLLIRESVLGRDDTRTGCLAELFGSVGRGAASAEVRG
jgi:hypothetical protein